MPASQARNPKGRWESKVRHMDTPVAMWKGAQINLLTLCRYWGVTESGWGSEKHATYIILFESSRMNTGEPARDVKESGK